MVGGLYKKKVYGLLLVAVYVVMGWVNGWKVQVVVGHLGVCCV